MIFESMAENRELALSISINQRNPPTSPEKDPGWGICYLALTFGTLLSSQGADAHVPRPIPRPFSVAVDSTLHRAPQQPNLRGSAGGFPDPCRPGPFSLGAGTTIHAP